VFVACDAYDESDYNSEPDYYSSEDFDSDAPHQEVYAGKRGRGAESRKESEAPGPSKTQRRDPNKLPRNREPVKATKPVLNPLTEEEKNRRKEVRAQNREVLQEQNLGIIRNLLKGCQQGLVAHRHLKHFRTDLHHHIDKAMFFNREQKKTRQPKATNAGTTTGTSNLQEGTSNASEEPISCCADNPLEKEEALPLVKERMAVSLDNPDNDSIDPSPLNFMSFELDDKSESFPIRTEILADVGKEKDMKITLDSGATFSGIPRNTCDRVGISGRIRPTRMSYRTSTGEVYQAEGKVVVHLRIGRLKIVASMIVMPYDCPYKLLGANDIMGPLKADVLRSTKVVVFHLHNTIVTTPLLHELLDKEIRRNDSFYIYATQLDAPEKAWVFDAPKTSVSLPKNGEAKVTSQ
jgi:hypothetical protein